MPAPKRNRNSERTGIYRLDRIRRGVGPALDGRCREAKLIAYRMNQVASDLGYQGIADAPAILQDVIRGMTFCGLQLRVIEGIPMGERTARMLEDYREWFKVILKSATILGTRRIPRDLGDLARDLADAGREAE